jgi:hypothetical protein
MLPHYIPLPHQFLQSWMKLSKCTIKIPIRPDISDPLARFQRGWADMSGFLKESSYRFTSQFIGQDDQFSTDFGRFSPAAVDFLANRSAVAHPTRFPAESGRFSPRRRGFLRPPTRSHAMSSLSAHPSITARSRSVFTPRRRFRPSRTGFGSSLDRSKWGMKNPLCCRVGETE